MKIPELIKPFLDSSLNFLSQHLTNGNFWILKCTFIITCFSFLTGLPSYTPNKEYYAYVDYKIEHPFEASNFDESLNVAKRDLRILPPIIGKTIGFNSIGLIILNNLMNCGFIFLTIVLFERILRNRTTSFLFSLGLSLTFLGKSGFTDTIYAHFDMIAFFLNLLAMCSHPILAIPLMFLSFFVDERALISGFFVLLYFYIIQKDSKPNIKYLVGFIISIVAYIISRYLLFTYFRLQTPIGNTADVGLKVLSLNILSFRGIIGTFLTFEFFWIIVFLAFIQLKYLDLNQKLGSLLLILVGIGSSWLVYDITRSISYIFPLVFLSVFIINKIYDSKILNYIAFVIMVMNFSIGSYSVKDIIDPLITSPANIKVFMSYFYAH